ncbi:MAG: hypothetical protein JSU87_05265 [Gemmatimonadota bacterium]|nr:MAG: hypothetical protein JSU87_05265 [Gemmatimonadota bacterium]
MSISVRGVRCKLVITVLAFSALSCGRSENIGWADRQRPETPRSTATDESVAPAAQEESSDTSREALTAEYEQLARALARVHAEAMEDPEIAAEWSALRTDADLWIYENSEFHQKLAERQAEIEDIMEESRRSVERLDPEQEAELARNFQNIQLEMARKRSEVLRKPEFAIRTREFQAALYDRMRQLQPVLTPEINRMEELELLLYTGEAATPPVAGLESRD